MNDSKKLELSIKTLVATIFLGVAGDLLLRDVEWGLGMAIYGLVIAAVSAYLYRHRISDFGKGVVWLIPPALLFASLFALRDSGALKLLNTTCLFLVVGILALRVRTGNITVATLVDYPCRLLERWVYFLSDFVHLATLEGKWSTVGREGVGKNLTSVIRGLLIAAPLLAIFAALFASSDAVFKHLASQAFSLDLTELFSHLFITGICVWMVGGFLRRLFLAADVPPVHGPSKEGTKLGLTEIVIVFGTLNALFLSFVAIQFRYLFGGDSLVQKTARLSYAEYAHQGFFELLTVAILGLGVLIGARSLVRTHEHRDWRVFASLAITLVTLIFVVMASAATRMQLYVQAYGITTERLYASAILLWVTLLFCGFCATSLRRKPDRFAFGGVGSFLVIAFALNVINPDGLIVRVNTTRTAAKVDASYLGSLSADAVPELVRAIPQLNPAAKENLKSAIEIRRKELAGSDWRSWSLSQTEASRALKNSTF